ncbi:hypothetical protein L4X63_20345 [Geomonas sp. Red32]|uniref:hypothetical protein n=1 Tax=Geomonas sp. Red32 TaxID=2912856 RepID=UPI00202CE6E6|nr:hypothetical protein [Geomonas sp. Red32]MCM0083936.1 hypothetical protein [Geomonas sp. Red32]
MTTANVDQEVCETETLARFIVQSSYIRRASNTVKQDAFIPHPHDDLSVTRHLELSEENLWEIGAGVALEREKTLYGRADNLASDYNRMNLHILPDPIPPTEQNIGNPNHAVVKGWPADKPSQKMLALEIASKAKFTPAP